MLSHFLDGKDLKKYNNFFICQGFFLLFGFVKSLCHIQYLSLMLVHRGGYFNEALGLYPLRKGFDPNSDLEIVEPII